MLLFQLFQLRHIMAMRDVSAGLRSKAAWRAGVEASVRWTAPTNYCSKLGSSLLSAILEHNAVKKKNPKQKKAAQGGDKRLVYSSALYVLASICFFTFLFFFGNHFSILNNPFPQKNKKEKNPPKQQMSFPASLSHPVA